MIKIDVDTRIWEIPEEEKFIGVESDGSVKKYKFELSKNEFYEGLNFTDCNCYINYKNEDNDAIPYGITDMAVQGDGKVTFTWEVSRGATIFQGNTFAVLCVKKVREDGTITNEWNSRIGAFIVNKGIEPKDSIAELPEIDIISQLLNTAQYVNQVAQQNISKSEENIAKSEELIQTAQELLEQNDFYTGYIVDGETYSGKASNSGIKLHKVVGKTEQKTTNGYQLFDSSKLATKSQGGATVTNNNDGSFTISGSGNLSEAYTVLYNCSKEESLKLLKVGIVKSNAENTIPQIRFGLRNVSNSTFVTGKCISYDYKTITLTEEDIQSIENGTNVLSFGFLGNSGNTITPATIKPMVYTDGDGTWEPFKHATVETSLTLAQDDIYQQGTITRARKQVVFDGSSDEGWTKSTAYENSFVIKINDFDINSNTFYSNRFKFTDKRNIFGTFFINSSGNCTFVIEGINELEEWKTWLSTHPTTIEYELATPTTEELKVPTIPSYYPYTNVSTDNDLETEMQWKILADSDRSLEVEEIQARLAVLEGK